MPEARVSLSERHALKVLIEHTNECERKLIEARRAQQAFLDLISVKYGDGELDMKTGVMKLEEQCDSSDGNSQEPQNQ